MGVLEGLEKRVSYCSNMGERNKNDTFLSVSAVTGLARAECDLERTEFQFMMTGERTEGRRKGKSERLST